MTTTKQLGIAQQNLQEIARGLRGARSMGWLDPITIEGLQVKLLTLEAAVTTEQKQLEVGTVPTMPSYEE